MTVPNDVHRFHLAMGAAERVPPARDHGAVLKERLQEEPIEPMRYLDKNGRNLRAIRAWKGRS